jgi:hypothetical protein
MKTNKNGFTLFFAMLAASLALAVGLAVYDLTARELDISATATQSQYAIYAADTGAECALYWDTHYSNAGTNNNGGSSSAFATSSADTLAATSGVICNGQDVAAVPWTVAGAAGAATTTFSLTIPNATSNPTQTYCATVVVAKYGSPSQTTVVAHGYNSCNGGPLQLERALQVTY